jgi:small-conductance mechanosensitive channel
VAVTVDIYLWRVLGLSDATRAIGERLRDYVWIPFRNMLTAVWEYLPNLLTIVLIVAVARLLLWTVRQVFKAVQAGTLSIPGFDREWANPTYRVARVLAVGLTLAIMFPLLPAYDSDAFKGLSIFGGFLLAFGSSGAVGNLVSGVFLTYTRACKPGDRVQIGDTLGDVQEQTFLALRIRTDRNQIVTIPSSVVLNSSVTNYTRRGLEAQTLLHTGVTIGYDAPWRTVHELLIKAALNTPDVLSFPEPFVWQRALNDFYVSYELNVSTTRPERMYWILDELHRHIQDAFFAAGVEIASPHYYALRDGSGLAMPAAQRPAGYESPAFQVSVATRTPERATPSSSRPSPPARDDDLPLPLFRSEGPR